MENSRLNTKLNYQKIMKRKFALTCLLIFSATCILFAQFVEYVPYQSNRIDNGWYESTAKYSNLKTGTSATYTLNVKVESNHIVRIQFEDGGSLHSGYNNEGYSYYGGSLSFEMDSNNIIKAATSTVTITERNGSTQTFKIRIE